jgi:hypothetical protein
VSRYSTNQEYRPYDLIEELEQRLAPAASLSYNVPIDGLSHALTLRFNSATFKFEILDNGVVAASRSASSTTSIEIDGVNNQNEALTLQIPSGGSLPPTRGPFVALNLTQVRRRRQPARSDRRWL